MEIRTHATLFTILLSVAAFPSNAGELFFNGYYAGMTKEAAKSLGAEACKHGAGLTEKKDAIYCDIPLSKRSLGLITATKATLEFNAPSHASVNQIRLSFAAPTEAVKNELQNSYGKPTQDEDFYYWERGSETGKLYKGRRGISYVTFEFDASDGKARAQAKRQEEQRQRALKNF